MDPIEQLREKIAGFPGYEGDIERRRSDAFVRSYLGEALADLSVRCSTLSPQLKARVDALLLRVGFADPKAFAVRRSVAEMQGALPGEGTVVAEDVAAVGVADRAPSVEEASVAAYLDEVTATLDRRDATMRAAAATS